MQKKRPQKPAPQPPKSNGTIDDRLDRLVIALIDDAEKKISAGEVNTTLHRAVFELSRARRMQKRSDDELEVALVVAWARDHLDRAERAALVRELQQLDTKGSGLA